MKRDLMKMDPGQGLAPPGPLSLRSSTMKVAVRPPDIPIMDKISELMGILKEKGIVMPSASSICIRSIDGFIQFKVLTEKEIPPSSVLRVIEFDPSRGTFIVSGDVDADLVTEMAWYVLKALPDIHLLLFIPLQGEEVDKDQSSLPMDKEGRIRMMLDLASRLKEKDRVEIHGYEIIEGRTMDELKNSVIRYKLDKDQSISQ